VVLVGGGYGLARLLSIGGSGTAASSNGIGPSRLAQAGGPGHGTSPGFGRDNTAPRTLPGESAAPLPVIRSGTDYQPGQLAAQVEHVLHRHPARAAMPANAQQLSTSRLVGCVSSLTGGVRPRLVDEARYRGQPATIIVTAATSSRPQQVWVVGGGCSATSPDVIAHAQLTGTG
jgi:hypothetical protein